jgi:hypothetical protein
MMTYSGLRPRLGDRSKPVAAFMPGRALQRDPMQAQAGQVPGSHFPGQAQVGGHDFGKMRIYAGGPPLTTSHCDGIDDDDPIHRPILDDFRREAGLPLSGVDEFGQRVGPSDAEIKYGGLRRIPGSPSVTPPVVTPTQKTLTPTPCPTSVSVGSVAQRNHSNLSATEKDQWRTWLGAMSRMDVGPGPDHTGHCMKEHLTVVSNDCPAGVYTRGGQTIQPCSGNKCLDINRYGSMWGVSDGPTSFLDMHRTRSRESLLEGTGVSSCSVVCEQTYTCDQLHATTGTFRITRNYQAGTHTLADGTVVHITTGTVTKT